MRRSGYPSAPDIPKPGGGLASRAVMTPLRSSATRRPGWGCRPAVDLENWTTGMRTTENGKEAGMSGLSRFEHRLEQLISGAFARAFRSAVQPVEISAALQRECDNNAQILSRDRRLVPNDFHVELSQTDLDRLAPYDTAMAQELVNQLQEHADQQSYVFPGPVTIGFESADDLTTGRFRIRSRAQAKVTGNASHTQVRRARALVEVNGTRHPLEVHGLVFGRGHEADVRINDS